MSWISRTLLYKIPNFYSISLILTSFFSLQYCKTGKILFKPILKKRKTLIMESLITQDSPVAQIILALELIGDKGARTSLPHSASGILSI